MVVCKYYLQGCCHFGNRCRYEHPADDYSAYSDGMVLHVHMYLVLLGSYFQHYNSVTQCPCRLADAT